MAAMAHLGRENTTAVAEVQMGRLVVLGSIGGAPESIAVRVSTLVEIVLDAEGVCVE